ncbi:MAG: hypothetical protein JJU35_01580 [Balneolales bacterium]|nr:hypothetical protein [Balneolales bacterium]
MKQELKNIRYISDQNGEITDAVVPVAVWKEVVNELKLNGITDDDERASAPQKASQTRSAVRETDDLNRDFY